MKLLIVLLISVFSTYAHGAGELDELAKFFNPPSNDTESKDQAAWQSLKLDPSNKEKIEAIFKLAGLANHHYAQNYAGCLLAKGQIVPQDRSRALRYFAQAQIRLPLASYNWGVTRLAINQNDPDAWKAIRDSFEKIKLKEAGELILYRQATSQKIDENHLDNMYSAKSSLAYYIKAYRLYQKANYVESLNIALTSADFGDLDSMLLVSKNHEALIPKDPSNEKQALKWSYIHSLYQDNKGNPQVNKADRSYLNDMDRDAWHEAVEYVTHRKRMAPSYLSAVCEPRRLIGN